MTIYYFYIFFCLFSRVGLVFNSFKKKFSKKKLIYKKFKGVASGEFIQKNYFFARSEISPKFIKFSKN